MSLEGLLLFVVGATIPLQNLGSFQIAGYPVGPGKASTAVFLVYAVVRTLFTGQGIPWNVKHLWVALFALSLLLANLIGGIQGVTIASRFVLWTSYLAVLIFYFLLAWALRSSRQVEILLIGIAFGAYVCVLVGLLRPEAFQEVGAERFTGTSKNPNDLGFSMALIIPLALALTFRRRKGYLRQLFVLGAIGTAVVGIVLSLSRAAFVMVAAMGALYIWRFGGASPVRYLPPALAAAIAVVVFAPASFFERVASFTKEEGRQEDSSIGMRFIEFKGGLHAFAHNPLLGVGDGLAGRWAAQHGFPMGEHHVIHNVYLDAAAEQGIVGLIPLLAIVALSWVDLSRVRRWSRDPRFRGDEEIAGLGLWATLFQIALLGAVLGQQFHPALRSKGFWLLLGLSSALVAIFRAQVLERHPGLLERPASSAATFLEELGHERHATRPGPEVPPRGES